MFLGSPSSDDHLKGYSEFFASGFRRAVDTTTNASHHHRRPTSLPAPVLFISDPSSSSGLPPRHPRCHHPARPVSMIALPTILQIPTASRSGHSRGASSSSRRRFASFFDRISFSSSSSSSGDEQQPSSARRLRNKIASRLSRSSPPPPQSAASARDTVWITTDGLQVPSAPNGGADTSRIPLDPFDSSPDSKSFFIDLCSSDSPTSPASYDWTAGTKNKNKRESFLSMSTSGKESSSSRRRQSRSSFSSSSGSFNLQLPQRRERPISVQTLPAAPSSRNSRHIILDPGVGGGESTTAVYRFPNEKSLASDFWILEEEPAEILPPPSKRASQRYHRDRYSGVSWSEGDHQYLSSAEENRDAARLIDWRQFHNDLLLNVVDG